MSVYAVCVCLEVITRKTLTQEAKLIALLSTSPSATWSPLLRGHILPLLYSRAKEKHIKMYKLHVGKRKKIGPLTVALCRVCKSTGWLSRTGSEVSVLQVRRRSIAASQQSGIPEHHHPSTPHHKTSQQIKHLKNTPLKI